MAVDYAVGSIIGDKRKYHIYDPFVVENGSQCQWTIAKRDDGTAVFLKQYLNPTYPPKDLSLEIQQHKLSICAEFEARHRTMMKILQEKCKSGGNLVIAEDFFRHGLKYYKATVHIPDSKMSVQKISTLSIEHRLAILAIVAYSLEILHDIGLVHGDLKPGNILIKSNASSDKVPFVPKLIDFDDSYFSGNPPPPDIIVGDFVYYSPELEMYQSKSTSATAGDLTCASDIFALGLIYCQYLSNKLPEFDNVRYKTAASAACAGQSLKIISKGLPDYLVGIVNAMMSPKPVVRPNIRQIREYLQKRIPPPLPPSTALKGSLLRQVLEAKPLPEVSSVKDTTGLKTNLRVNFGKKSK